MALLISISTSFDFVVTPKISNLTGSDETLNHQKEDFM